MPSDTPHKPRLIVNVGIIGHRPNRLTASADDIIRKIEDVLRGISDRLNTLAAENTDVVSTEKPVIRVLSALAEGADRFGAVALRNVGSDLKTKTETEFCAVLPFVPDEYAKDFAEAASRDEFATMCEKADGVLQLLGERAQEVQAYEAAGFEILRRSDLLIAVWDRGSSAGRGGTTDMIERALAIDMPVVCIDAAGQHAPTFLCRAESRLPYPEPGFDAYAHCDIALLADAIDGVLAPPATENDASALRAFVGERERQWCKRCGYPILLAVMLVRGLRWSEFRVPPYLDGARKELGAFLAQISARVPAAALDRWLRAYAFSDRLAVHYSQTFRSAYVSNFFFAAVAVFLALFSIPFSGAKFWLVLAEVFAIGVIVCNTIFGQARNWHRKWMDYRHLAERLRLVPLTAVLGAVALPKVARVPNEHDRSPDWVAWYADQVAREFPITQARFDTDWVASLKTMLVALVQDQIDYHSRNAKRLEDLDHRLHNVGSVAFGLTLVICILFLIAYLMTKGVLPDWLGPWVAVWTALLPAAGAAILGIQVQGDFEGFAHRSHATAAELTRILTDLEKGPQDLEHLRFHATRAAQAISADLGDWRHTFEGRTLKLPG